MLACNLELASAKAVVALNNFPFYHLLTFSILISVLKIFMYNAYCFYFNSSTPIFYVNYFLEFIII